MTEEDRKMVQMVQAALERPTDHVITITGGELVLGCVRIGTNNEEVIETVPVHPNHAYQLHLNGVRYHQWGESAILPPPPVDHTVCVLSDEVLMESDPDLDEVTFTYAKHGIELERLARAYVFECAIDAESRFNALEAYLKGMKA